MKLIQTYFNELIGHIGICLICLLKIIYAKESLSWFLTPMYCFFAEKKYKPKHNAVYLVIFLGMHFYRNESYSREICDGDISISMMVCRGHDRLSGKGQMPPIAATSQEEEGVTLRRGSSVLPLSMTHSLCNLSLCKSQYPSLYISRLLTHIYDVSNRIFEYSISPESTNWHLKSSVIENQNMTTL